MTPPSSLPPFQFLVVAGLADRPPARSWEGEVLTDLVRSWASASVALARCSVDESGEEVQASLPWLR